MEVEPYSLNSFAVYGYDDKQKQELLKKYGVESIVKRHGKRIKAILFSNKRQNAVYEYVSNRGGKIVDKEPENRTFTLEAYDSNHFAVYNSPYTFKNDMTTLGGKYDKNLNWNNNTVGGYIFPVSNRKKVEIFVLDNEGVVSDVIPKGKVYVDNSRLQLEDYSDRSFAVYGNTFPHRDTFRKLGGRYDDDLKRDGEKAKGYIFFSAKRDDVEKYVLDNGGTILEKKSKKSILPDIERHKREMRYSGKKNLFIYGAEEKHWPKLKELGAKFSEDTPKGADTDEKNVWYVAKAYEERNKEKTEKIKAYVDQENAKLKQIKETVKKASKHVEKNAIKTNKLVTLEQLLKMTNIDYSQYLYSNGIDPVVSKSHSKIVHNFNKHTALRHMAESKKLEYVVAKLVESKSFKSLVMASDNTIAELLSLSKIPIISGTPRLGYELLLTMLNDNLLKKEHEELLNRVNVDLLVAVFQN